MEDWLRKLIEEKAKTHNTVVRHLLMDLDPKLVGPPMNGGYGLEKAVRLGIIAEGPHGMYFFTGVSLREEKRS